MAALGSSAHRALIEQVIAHYSGDDRVRAVAVFGSVATGAWHELSDVDLDVVIGDCAAVQPADEDEAAALFGPAAAIIVAQADSADLVLESLEEIFIRWHSLRSTSPNISATVRVVHGGLSDADLAAVIAETQAHYDLGPRRRALLDQAEAHDAVGGS
jgi:predicted nucleotidyltransferase